MAFILADRVKDSTTTTGTGTITLSGSAPTGFQNFSAVGNANTTYYCIAGQSTAEWEIGIGTYTAAGTTLSRTTVLASSNAGALVSFSAGTKDVFVDAPAALLAALVPYSGATSNLNMGAFTVTLPTPSASTDGANKAYVDSIAQGLSVKPSAVVATAAALPTNTYNNGSSGVGATLTGVGTGVLTVDGHAVALNEYLLVKNEVVGANNGLYKCTLAGAVGVAYILTRALEMDSSAEYVGAFMFIEQGSTYTSTGWVCTNSSPPTVGTTAVTFTQFSGPVELGNAIHAATSKTTPVDADEFGIWDSVAGALNKLTWANLKATILAYITTALSAPVGVVSINSGALSGNSNRIINARLAIDQINGGASKTITAGAALLYVIDQMYAYCTGANVTGQQVAGTGQDQYGYLFTGAASVTAIGFGTRIEKLYTYDMNNGNATFVVKLANSVLTTVNWAAYYANTADTFGTLASPTRTAIASGSFTVNSTLTQYSATMAIPAAATTGIEIVLSVGAQTSGTWRIEDLQLVKGSVAPTYSEYRMDELQLCQRYCRGYAAGAIDFIGSNYQAGQNNSIILASGTYRGTPALTSTWTYFNAGSASLIIADPNYVEINIINTAAGQWRLTNTTLALVTSQL